MKETVPWSFRTNYLVLVLFLSVIVYCLILIIKKTLSSPAPLRCKKHHTIHRCSWHPNWSWLGLCLDKPQGCDRTLSFLHRCDTFPLPGFDAKAAFLFGKEITFCTSWCKFPELGSPCLTWHYSRLEWELGMHVPLDELLSSIARARSRRGDGTSIIIFDKPAPDNLLYLRSLLMAPRSLSLFRKWSTQIGTALFHSIDSYVEVLSSAGETVPWYSTSLKLVCPVWISVSGWDLLNFLLACSEHLTSRFEWNQARGS